MEINSRGASNSGNILYTGILSAEISLLVKCYYRISSVRRGGGGGEGHVKRRDGRGREDCELFVYLADLGGAKMPGSDALGNDLIINQTERCIARSCVARSLPPRAEGALSLWGGREQDVRRGESWSSRETPSFGLLTTRRPFHPLMHYASPLHA